MFKALLSQADSPARQAPIGAEAAAQSLTAALRLKTERGLVN